MFTVKPKWSRRVKPCREASVSLLIGLTKQVLSTFATTVLQAFDFGVRAAVYMATVATSVVMLRATDYAGCRRCRQPVSAHRIGTTLWSLV